VVIHPFLNGNGRWSRMLANSLINVVKRLKIRLVDPQAFLVLVQKAIFSLF
jgi:fido (protein-threonine AMPylation protein)